MPSMGSADRNGQPEHALSRRNTFQRMLELERRNKVNRMQASPTAGPPPAHTSTAMARDSSHRQHLELRPSSLKTNGRAMAAPTLSLAVPPAKVSFDTTTTKYVIRSDGDVVPQEEESDEDSETSSICHSPGWEDSSSKKRRKEKRDAKERKKREKAKSEADAAKQELKAKSRLSKPPPAHKRFSKMVISMDRSISEPAVPVVQSSPEVQEGKEERKKDIVGRARRGSLELGLKSFIQVKNAISGPWKSSHSTPAQTTPTQETAPPTIPFSVATGGFIGGLKLRQAEEATVRETIRKVKNPADDDTRKLPDCDRELTAKDPENLSSNTSIAKSSRPVSIYQDSIRSPEEWDSLYTQAAMLVRNSVTPKVDDDTTPIMERNIRKSRKTHPPTSRCFPLANDPDSSPSRRDTSTASTSRTSIRSSQYGGGSQGSRESNVSSGQSDSIRSGSADRSEMTESNRGRTKSSYIGYQRRQSEDRYVAGYQDQQKVSEVTTHSNARDGSDSNQRAGNKARMSSGETQSTAKPVDGNNAGATETKPVQPVLVEKHKPAPLELVSTTDASFKPSRKSSRSHSAVRGLKDLKNATKSAFSKHSSKPESPTGSFVSASEFQKHTSLRPQSNTAVTTSAVNEKPSKAERVLGESLNTSPIVHDFALHNRPGPAPKDVLPHRRLKARSRGQGKNSTPGMGISGRATYSRSATDSSEDYSLNDESSNITTPTASRPHSHKDYSPSSQDFKLRGGKKSEEQSVQEDFAMMSGAVLDDAASRRDSWCRTAIPIELTEDEDRMKTPTAKRSAADLTTSKPETPKPSNTDSNINLSELHRQPSLSRSMSTPELQDLSFLPALKHQPLAHPLKEKGKGILGRKGKQAFVSKEQEDNSTKDPTRPLPIPVSGATTKSESSSPTSPQSSQYLQNARLNIPRPPRSPMKTGFPPTHLQHPQVGGPEPLAKMFVVCCSCKYFHDMPSKIYECMAKPDNIIRDTSLGVSGVISTSVKCPWCGHGMSTGCCTGYAAVVYLREKLH